MEFIDPNEVWKLRDTVLSKISIIDVAKEYGLQMEVKETGAFTHRAYCPFHEGKGGDGKERTPSMFLSQHSNSFCCFGCMHEDTLVWTTEGLRNLKFIKIGDYVLDINGHFSKVLYIENDKKEKMLQISLKSCRRSFIHLTDNHRCIYVKSEDLLNSVPYITRASKRRFGVRFHGAKKGTYNNIPISVDTANNIRCGDFLIFPVISSKERFVKDLDGSKIIKKYYKGPRTDRILSLPFNAETCWLYGLWLAEGSVGRGCIRFTFNLKESKTLAKLAQKILLKHFNVKSRIFLYESKNTCELIASKTDLEHLFRFWFCSGACNKKLPSEMIMLPEDLQEHIIKGYFDGDGDKKGHAKTISEQLAFGFYCLIIQSGHLPSLSFKKSYVDKNNIKHKDSWNLYIKKRESLSGFFDIINNTKYYFSMIDDINYIINDSNVVDITVENSNSFTNNLCVLHNCGISGSIIDFVSQMDGTPPVIALTKLAKKIGLINKNGEWDNLQLEYNGPHKTFDPNKTIDPYIFKISDLLRNYIEHFKDNENFDKELKWMERVACKVDSFLTNIGYEDWEYASELLCKVERAVKNRLRLKGVK